MTRINVPAASFTPPSNDGAVGNIQSERAASTPPVAEPSGSTRQGQLPSPGLNHSKGKAAFQRLVPGAHPGSPTILQEESADDTVRKGGTRTGSIPMNSQGPGTMLRNLSSYFMPVQTFHPVPLWKPRMILQPMQMLGRETQRRRSGRTAVKARPGWKIWNRDHLKSQQLSPYHFLQNRQLCEILCSKMVTASSQISGVEWAAVKYPRR